MARLAGMDKLRRGSGRGQGGRDLAADMAALADAGDDDAPAHRCTQRDRGGKAVVESFGQAFEAADFGADHPAGDADIGRAGGDPWPGRLGDLRLGRGEDIGHRHRAAHPVRSSGGGVRRIDGLARRIARLVRRIDGMARKSPRPVRKIDSVENPLSRLRVQCAKMSCSAQPPRSSSTRCGKNSKLARASWSRPSRISIASSRSRSAWRWSTSEAA